MAHRSLDHLLGVLNGLIVSAIFVIMLRGESSD